MPVADLPATAEEALNACSQRATFPMGKIVGEGSALSLFWDENHTLNLHQRTWQIRTKTPEPVAYLGKKPSSQIGMGHEISYLRKGQTQIRHKKNNHNKKQKNNSSPWLFSISNTNTEMTARKSFTFKSGLYDLGVRLTSVTNITVKMLVRCIKPAWLLWSNAVWWWQQSDSHQTRVGWTSHQRTGRWIQCGHSRRDRQIRPATIEK